MIVLKYWKWFIAAALLIGLTLCYTAAVRRSYAQGEAAATARISAELAKTAARQAKAAHRASEKYQADKSNREQKERIRYVEVQKIVERPVYRNDCFDADGLRQLNAAIAGKP